jgi:hypothetical protein
LKGQTNDSIEWIEIDCGSKTAALIQRSSSPQQNGKTHLVTDGAG